MQKQFNVEKMVFSIDEVGTTRYQGEKKELQHEFHIQKLTQNWS